MARRCHVHLAQKLLLASHDTAPLLAGKLVAADFVRHHAGSSTDRHGTTKTKAAGGHGGEGGTTVLAHVLARQGWGRRSTGVPFWFDPALARDPNTRAALRGTLSHGRDVHPLAPPLGPACAVDSPATAAASIAPAPAQQERLALFDGFRGVASQLILLHHMAFYGPLSDYVTPLAPALVGWFSEHARMAVQVFLVVGGFFTARVLNRRAPLQTGTVVRLLWKRFRRLSGPYWVALAVAVGANALASRWMQHASISPPPTLGQLLAHVLLLHDLLGYPALSAGVWYLAIDFQLFLVCSLVYWACSALVRKTEPTEHSSPAPAATLVLGALAVASLFWFNRHSEYDHLAVYFMGAYFAGFLLNEVLERRVRGLWGAAYWTLCFIAAVIDPRPRLMVATVTAIALFAATRARILRDWSRCSTLAYLGKISYSLFLIHFPLLLVVNAWGSKRWLTPGSAALGMLLGYGLSIGAGSLLYHAVERRTQ